MPSGGRGSVVHGIACLGEGFGDSDEIRTKGSCCVPPSTTAPVPCLIPILLPQPVLPETLPTSAFIKLGFLSSEFGHLQIQLLGGSGLAALPAARGERTFKVSPHPPQR